MWLLNGLRIFSYVIKYKMLRKIIWKRNNIFLLSFSLDFVNQTNTIFSSCHGTRITTTKIRLKCCIGWSVTMCARFSLSSNMNTLCAKVLATNKIQLEHCERTIFDIKAYLWLAAVHSTICHDSRNTIRYNTFFSGSKSQV